MTPGQAPGETPSASLRCHPSYRPVSAHHSRKKTTASGGQPIRGLTGCYRSRSSRGPWERSPTSPSRRSLAERATRAMSTKGRRALTELAFCSRTSLGLRDGQPPRDWRGRPMSRVSQEPWGQIPRRPSRTTLAAGHSRTSPRPSGGRAAMRRGGPSGGHCYRGSRRRGSGSPRKMVSRQVVRAGCGGLVPSIISLRSSFHGRGGFAGGGWQLRAGENARCRCSFYTGLKKVRRDFGCAGPERGAAVDPRLGDPGTGTTRTLGTSRAQTYTCIRTRPFCYDNAN